MGLLKHLLFWPVTAPISLARFSLNQVERTAHQELADDTRVKQDLMELQMLLELGDIDEEEYARREAEILEQLREVREWQEHLGMATPWAPLEFSSPDEDPDEPPAPAPGSEAPS